MNINILRQELGVIENLAQSKRYTEAWSRLDGIKGDNPKDKALVCMTRAYVHSREGNNDAAIADLNRSIYLFSNEPHPYYTRGILFFQLRRYFDAVQDFSKVLELSDILKSDYYRESAYFLRADSFVKLNEFEKARADCAKVRDGYKCWTDKLRTKEDILSECSNH